MAPTDKDFERLEARVEAGERTMTAIQVKTAEDSASMRGALAILTAKVDEISAKLDAGFHVPSKLLPWLILVLGSAGLLGPGVAEVARGALTAGVAAQAPAPPALEVP